MVLPSGYIYYSMSAWGEKMVQLTPSNNGCDFFFFFFLSPLLARRCVSVCLMQVLVVPQPLVLLRGLFIRSHEHCSTYGDHFRGGGSMMGGGALGLWGETFVKIILYEAPLRTLGRQLLRCGVVHLGAIFRFFVPI